MLRLALWTLAAALPGAVQDDAELGQKAYQAGQFAEAADRFEKAVARDKKSAPLWIALGHASLQAGRWEAAVRAYQEAIGLKAETAEVDRALARALDQGGRVNEAIAALRRAGTLDPSGSDVLTIARLFIRREDWLLAEQEILTFLRAFPGSVEGLESLAYILGRSGRAAQAAEVYRDLERRSPVETKYRIARARLAASQSHYGEAIEALEVARLLGGLKDEDERLLADLYLQEKMYPEAAACYARRLALSHPPKADDAYRMGHAYYESKQFSSAKDAFQKAIEIDPAYGGAYLYLGHVATAQGNVDEARRLFARAMEKMPQSSQPSIALGNLEMKESQWVKAAEAFRESLKRGSSDPAVLYNVAYCWYQAGRKDEARSALKEALRQAPLDDRLRGLLHEIEG